MDLDLLGILGSSGNSLGFIVASLYNEPSHSITNKLLLVQLFQEKH